MARGLSKIFKKKSYKTTLKQGFVIGKGYFAAVRYKSYICKNPRDFPIAGILVLQSSN